MYLKNRIAHRNERNARIPSLPPHSRTQGALKNQAEQSGYDQQSDDENDGNYPQYCFHLASDKWFSEIR
ncbi:hypothetical protein Q8A64_17000 [Oxalobacteraceae bacterium R-40]|uniref:Uncharacterized protein n=1 Tax=Keguizhuia sedimenti TaxID=3064264 RepID=A0ABU1BSX3_9BURK|nr:hypothetical protein [Oxalobacteraceae bacterium R-40]